MNQYTMIALTVILGVLMLTEAAPQKSKHIAKRSLDFEDDYDLEKSLVSMVVFLIF